jgi:uncharacterized damage-inducible protein DinB
MPAKMPSRVLTTPAGFRSREAGSFARQLEFVSARRFAGLAGISAAELAWQPRPGANTSGMLLAHIPISELYWMLRIDGDPDPARIERMLGLAIDGDGMPMPARARPPAALARRTLAWYRRLHGRARTYTLRALREMGSRELGRVIVARHADGGRVAVNVRWILFHLLEHEAAHYGQIMQLRHAWRDRARR